MPTNGTLKYKQDDGSIVELNPAGVDAEARALANAETERAKAAEQKLENDKADKSAIPDVSALVTKATYNAGQAAQDAEIAALKAVAPDILPYLFDKITLSSFIKSSTDSSFAEVSIDLPWLHSQKHQLTAKLSGSPLFYVVNLRTGSVETVTEGITTSTICRADTPYHVNVTVQIPAAYEARIPYLVVSPVTFIILSGNTVIG